MKINHAILHVFDFISCVNVFATEEVNLEDKSAKSFISKHANKALNSLDNKHGVFYEDSMFAEELQAYAQGQRSFMDMSRKIADYLADELGRQQKADSTDLLIVDFEVPVNGNQGGEATDEEVDASFEGQAMRYFAILLLDSKQAYMHEVGRGDGGRNDIARHFAILPNPSQKVQSYAVIDLMTGGVTLSDKKRLIAGEERFLLADGLLQCSMEASSKEAFSAVADVVETVANEYGANSALALSRAKAYAAEVAFDDGDFDLDELGREVFDGRSDMMGRFDEYAAEEHLSGKMKLDKAAVQRFTKNHKIRTDTGIEITFPAEYGRNPDFIEFISEPDGRISISLKNIGYIENR
ncbi:nucleoid-associated protein [Slackia heliotrinireducens]|uniref:nucleoid-associated protein n=1 Tax=Slackia heliotrinireducens TaxID=84110 RepID=UPI0033145B58